MLARDLGADIALFHQSQNRGGRRTNRCGPFALAMAANLLLGDSRFDGDEISAELDKRWIELWPIPRVNRFPKDTATLPGAMVRFLKHQGLHARLHARGTLAQIRGALDHGHVVLPIFGQWTHRVQRKWRPWGHTVALVGYDAHSLFALDPAEECANVLMIPHDPWLTWWRSMGRLWVDAWL